MGQKTGRNEPCPCGSGKKYKHCCGRDQIPQSIHDAPWTNMGFSDEAEMKQAMKRYELYLENHKQEPGPIPSFMEFLGRPNSATNSANELHKAMEKKIFSNKAEANAFMKAFTEQSNSQAREDFLGLSSQQMQVILYGSREENAQFFIPVDGNLPKAVQKALLPAMTLYILKMHNANGSGALGLTATASYKPDLVKEVVKRFFIKDDFQSHFTREYELQELIICHDFLIHKGYTEETSTKSRLSASGLAFLDSGGIDQLWRELFDYMLFDSEWVSFLRESMQFESLNFIQQSAVYSLFLLKKKATSWMNAEELYQLFLQAFPSFDPKYGSDSYEPGFITYRMLFLDLFCVNMGLAEYDENHGVLQSHLLKSKIRATELIQKALDWKI